MPLIDVIKGLACLSIVGHHFALYGPMPAGAAVLAPALFQWFVDEGRLAVQVFLVVGGFLAAASLAPDGALRGDRRGVRIAQRYMRLVMPYFVALIFSVLVAAVARPWLDNELVPLAPTLVQLLAHGLLLQDLLGQEALSAGVWYVAVDFQLFTLALGVLALAKGVRWVGVALVLAGTAASLAVFNREPALDDTALYFFGAYGLGMLSFWIGRARRASTWWLSVALLIALGAVVLTLAWRSRIAIALVTAVALAVMQRQGGLERVPAFGGATLVRLGHISYALFLLHFPVLLAVSAIDARWWPVGPWIDAGGLLLAFAVSVGAAVLVHRAVESRLPDWRVASALFAALLLSGLLTSL
ncbi:MAG: acyltransferase [Variovorax sp.]|nr:MAG: acyltransferase [Variovorax sp.]